MTVGLRVDLHVHSDGSPDGRDSVDRLVARAVELGLDGLALTDHNSVVRHARLTELARDRPQLRLIPGVEVSTAGGHLLALGVTVAPPRDLPVEETIDQIRADGGVPVLAHPLRWVHGAGPAATRRVAVPALEVLNGHTGASRNAGARRIAEDRSLGRTGGSDAHTAGDLGRAWTAFPEGASSVDELLDAIRKGSTTAGGSSPGPLDRCRIAARSFGRRLARGLRPI